MNVLRFLNRKQLADAGLVSREWLQISREQQLWEPLCRETWRDKAHVRQEDLSDLLAGRARLALQRSIQSSTQLHIDVAELCSQNWSFRFKRAAGRAWTGEDPWWGGLTARSLRFLPDGTVAWATGSFDWVPPMRWALEDAPDIGSSSSRRSRRGRNGSDGGENRRTLLRITAEDTPQGSFPGHLLIRHHRWGYVFHSAWAVYASFPLHIATDDKSLLDRRLDKLVEAWQWAEVHAYNEAEDSSDSGEG